MKLRLWANWSPTAEERSYGLHLELERPYSRVPAIGESIALPRTAHGASRPIIENVYWDEALPNLILGAWEEIDGAERSELTEAGFHMTDASVPGCEYCRAHSAPMVR